MSTNTWEPAASTQKQATDPLAFLRGAKPMPTHIETNINGLLWARALILNEPYREPRPGVMSTTALVKAMDADDLFAQPEDSDVIKIGDYLENQALASSGNLTAHDIYVYPSDGEGGAPTYCDVNIIQEGNGLELVLRIGSRRLQMFYLKALVRGEWPIKHRLGRTNNSVRGTYGYRALPPQ
jgi:hypothetical protein